MSIRKILSFIISLIVGLALLSACGGSPSSTAPAPAGSSDSAAAPTSAPAAAPEPSEAPAESEPTIAPVAPKPGEEDGESPNEPMPVLPPRTPESMGESAEQPGKLTPFEQSNGLFQIDVPENWQADEERSSDEVRNIFRSPDERSFLAVYLNQSSNFNDREQLAIDLEEYLSQELGTTVQVKVGEPDSTGRLSVDLSYNLPDDTVGHKGSGYIANRGNLISFVIFSTPSDQFNLWSNTLTASADSFLLGDNASLK